MRTRIGLAIGIILAAGSACWGQHALGDGRALERQLARPGTPPIRRDYFGELAFREAIVSGRVGSGFSFRGDALPGRYEFRGELGEDDLFAFRRDSLYSGLAGTGLRGTDALQYQYSLTTGSAPPANLAGGLVMRRGGIEERGPRVDAPTRREPGVVGEGVYTNAALQDAFSLDSTFVQPVRSVASYQSNRALQPSLLGVGQDKFTKKRTGLTASPLMGIRTESMDRLFGPPAEGEPGALEEPAPGTASPRQASPGQVAPTGPGLPGVTGTKVRTAHDEFMDRYKALLPGDLAPVTMLPVTDPATGLPELPVWAKDIQSLRMVLQGRSAGGLPGSTSSGGTGVPGLPGATGVPGAADPPSATGASPLSDRVDERFDPAVFQRLREAGGVSSSLIATDVPEIDRYAGHMRAAQELLAKGRFFDAEERFIAALAARPGDVNAEVGRVHAQVGAGLFLSAALNLRQLYFNYPEMSAMKYGPDVLPSAERQEFLLKALREGVGKATTEADSGLLLAYFGFQRGEPAMMEEGLAAFERAGADADRRLATLLRGVWLSQDPPAEK